MSRYISTGYVPRDLQAILHKTLMRFNVLVCHRRFGKTVFCLNEMIDKGLTNQRKNPRYVYFAPFYGQAKKVAWDYLKEYTQNIPGMTANEAELRVDIPRPWLGDTVRYTLMGADNPGAIRGMYFDGAILDEYAEMDPTVWTQVIRPALSDRKGWAVFIGTPKGQNHFYDIFRKAKKDPEWFTAVYRASETGIIDPDELAAAKRDMDPDEFEQEFECSFSAALKGAYYGHLITDARKKNRIISVPYDPTLPVHTAWDLGRNDATAIWWYQMAGMEVHWLQYYENSDKNLDHYAAEIKKYDYPYEEHILPHDAAAKSFETGNTREETLRNLKIGRTRILPRLLVQDRINAARNTLKMSWFDEDGCAQGLDALENYRRAWDNKRRVFSNEPYHNWASNGADAFGYGCLGMKHPNQRQDYRKMPKQSIIEYDPFTMEEVLI